MVKIAVTGHRPQRLEQMPGMRKITEWFDKEIQKYDDYVLISGMAPGFDQIAALETLRLGGKVWCFFAYRHNLSIIEDYIAAKASRVRYEQDKRTDGCHDVRDRHMVDLCDVLVACWDGKKNGGVWRTIEYARKVGKPIVYLGETSKEKMCVSGGSFIEMCRRGTASPDDFNDFVERWHKSGSALSLHEYLGMTREQYARVITGSDVHRSIEEIVNAQPR